MSLVKINLNELHSSSNSFFKVNFFFLPPISFAYPWQITVKLCDSLLLCLIPYIEALCFSTYIFLSHRVKGVCVVGSARLSCLLDYTVVAPIFSPAQREEKKFSYTNIALDITMQSPWKSDNPGDRSNERKRHIFLFPLSFIISFNKRYPKEMQGKDERSRVTQGEQQQKRPHNWLYIAFFDFTCIPIFNLLHLNSYNSWNYLLQCNVCFRKHFFKFQLLRESEKWMVR